MASRVDHSGPGVSSGRSEDRRLRVLYLPSWYPHPLHQTYAVFIQVQAAALAKRHDIVVVPVPQPASLLGSTRNWRDRIDMRRTPAGFLELHVSGPNYTPRARHAHERVLWRLYRRSFDEATRIFGGPPDVIHAQVSVAAGYFAARLARTYRRPLVLTEHISHPELLLATPQSREWFHDAMKTPECVMAVSSQQRNLLHEAGVQREIDVVANLIDTEFFSPAEPAAAPPLRLIVVGNLIPRKGVQHLVTAVARLALEDGIVVHLEVVGRGECQPQLATMARSLGIGEAVRFHGELSQQGVRDLLRRCHIYVSSSLTESFGVAVIEAMSVGLPVVVTRSGGPESYVTRAHGVVVEPGSPEALARGIREVITRLGDFDRQRQHQYVVDNFSQDVVVREITKRYHLAIERHATALP